MRSRIVVALVAAVALVGTAQASHVPFKPLTQKGAEARTRAVMKQERANDYGARQKIRGDFTTQLRYCQRRYPNGNRDTGTIGRYGCLYLIVSREATSKDRNGDPARRQCPVKLEVRKSRKTGRVTHTRSPLKCYVVEPTIVGPPVGGGSS